MKQRAPIVGIDAFEVYYVLWATPIAIRKFAATWLAPEYG